MDAVTADLERFMRRVAEVADRPATDENRGGHVRGSARRGQVLDIAVDPAWAHTARSSELEQELLEVLRALRARSADLSQGPQSPAIAELTALVSDPNTLLRRVPPPLENMIDPIVQGMRLPGGRAVGGPGRQRAG